MTIKVTICHSVSFERRRAFGTVFAQNQSIMNSLCQHCDQMIIGKSYRVLSKEHGVILLDMIVCRSCRDRAKELGLRTEKVNSTISHAMGWMASAHLTFRVSQSQ